MSLVYAYSRYFISLLAFSRRLSPLPSLGAPPFPRLSLSPLAFPRRFSFPLAAPRRPSHSSASLPSGLSSPCCRRLCVTCISSLFSTNFRCPEPPFPMVVPPPFPSLLAAFALCDRLTVPPACFSATPPAPAWPLLIVLGPKIWVLSPILPQNFVFNTSRGGDLFSAYFLSASGFSLPNSLPSLAIPLKFLGISPSVSFSFAVPFPSQYEPPPLVYLPLLPHVPPSCHRSRPFRPYPALLG